MTLRYFQSSEWYRASTLAERVASLRRAPSENRTAVIDTDLAARRIERWQSQPPFSTDAYFAQRLQMEGLSEDELFYLLGEPVEAIQQRLPHKPEWLEKLAQAFDQPDASHSICQSHAERNRNPDFSVSCFQPVLTRVSAHRPMKPHIIQVLRRSHWTNGVSN